MVLLKGKGLSYNDVSIVPQVSEVIKNKIDTTPITAIFPNTLHGNNITSPIISSPMDTVASIEMIRVLRKLGCLGAQHRYNNIQGMIDVATLSTNIPIAVGTIPDHKAIIDTLADSYLHNFFIVDVAHGAHIKALQTIEYIKNTYKHSIVMSGSIATRECAMSCLSAGADILRVGVGSGGACTTRVNIGVGMPMITSIMNIRDCNPDVCIVADGSIKTGGDIAKAIISGADFVMCGSVLAGHDECPGKIIQDIPGTSALSSDQSEYGRQWKIFRGMASESALTEGNGKNKESAMVEGEEMLVPYKGKVENTINRLHKELKQSMFYSGASNISELKQKGQLVIISQNSFIEGTAHTK